MNTYSSKANAKRAAKTAGLNLIDVAIYAVGERWAYEMIDAPVVKEPAPLPSVESMVGYNPQLLLTWQPVEVVVVKSTAKNPVKLVWEIADANWGKKRSEIIQMCVEAGIAYNTARTQYQAFYQLKRLEGKN